MSTMFSTPVRVLKAAVAAATVTLSLGAATLAGVGPAEAGYYVDGFHHPHHRVFHRFGFRHPGFAYRPMVRPGYRPFFRRFAARPFPIFHGPVYGYGYGFHHGLPRAWGHYDWHHRSML